MTSQEFIDSIEHWWNCLNKRIEASIAKDHGLCLVAISRKMPRIFEWIKYIWIPSIEDINKRKEYEEQFKRIEGICLVCEHALPFIFASQNHENKDIIVIDDIIIRGTSMNEVVNDIYAYTQNKPYISYIFISSLCDYTYPNAIFEDSTRIAEEEIRSIVDLLCECIKISSLPMELEFPVFHLPSSYETLYGALLEGNKELNYRNYTIKHKVKNIFTHEEIEVKNFSIILEHELKWTLNHDYPKLRLFEKNNVTAYLEVSAPRVIPVADIESPDLFKEPQYHDLWKSILEAVGTSDLTYVADAESKNRVSRRRALTLTVWANYLFSFSVAMNACRATSLLSQFPEEPKVEEKDITLLLGPGYAKKIVSLLNKIGNERITEPWLIEKYYDTEMYIAEEEVKEKYENKRYYFVLNFGSIAKGIEKLFESHQNPKELDLLSSRLPRLGETISSLEDIFNYPFNENEAKYVTELNHALDQGIDEGRISPFYSQVESSTGLMCWRRFYRGGSRSIL